MKVALLHHRYGPGGGMERYLFDLVQGFADAGDRVEVWARDIDPGVTSAASAIHRIKVWPAPRLLRNKLLYAASQRLDLRSHYDLVLSLTRGGGEDAYICGGTHPGYLRALGKAAGLRDRIEIQLERDTALDSSVVVAHSRLIGEELSQHYGVKPERLQVIYPPLDTRRFQPVTSARKLELRQQWGFDPALKLFLFPSMGHARKGYDLLLAAFERLQSLPIQLLVAGRAGLKQPLANVRELGYVSQMQDLYAAADYTALPSRYEPFGLALTESLQCGTPVIASPRCGATELMRADEGIILPELTVDAVCAAVQRACDSHFSPDGNFAGRNGLELPTHVERLRQIKRP